MNSENLWACLLAVGAFLSLQVRKLKRLLKRKKVVASYQHGTAMLRIQETKSCTSQEKEKAD